MASRGVGSALCVEEAFGGTADVAMGAMTFQCLSLIMFQSGFQRHSINALTRNASR